MAFQYRVVRCPSHIGLDSLVEDVNAFIADGWVPQGGIAVGAVAGMSTYFQAMVKEVDKAVAVEVQ